MDDRSDQLVALRKRLQEAEIYLDLKGKQERFADLESEAGGAGLWDDPERARAVTTELGRVGDDIRLLKNLDARLSDAEVLEQLAVEEGDASLDGEIGAAISSLSRDLHDLELRSLFNGEHDELDAVCEIHAGAGGTDSQDWAEMMLRMYTRWAERRGFQLELEEISAGQEAGILSTTFIIKGRYAYGLLSSERGTHRLVRISPFDSQARRHTSFASFDLVPFIEDSSAEITVDEKDLRIDTYRSSGAGGQHVNVTDSAVRITHLPTNIVVAVQNERSQHQNKAKAMQILASKLVERQRQDRQRELDAISGPQTDVAWGTQIRSYVMAPYQLVKDLRTDYETGNVSAVIDGDLDQFMESYLRWRRTNGGGPS